MTTRKKKEIKEVSLEAMERLDQIMNDSPTIAKMGKTEFPITAFKPGTQWLIAEESCKIQKAEKGKAPSCAYGRCGIHSQRFFG